MTIFYIGNVMVKLASELKFLSIIDIFAHEYINFVIRSPVVRCDLLDGHSQAKRYHSFKI